MQKYCLSCLFILGVSLYLTSAEAQIIPKQGIVLSGQEKQAYIEQHTSLLFHEKTAARAMEERKFKLPENWQLETLKIGNVDTEQLCTTYTDSKRIILQFHGGGYIWPLNDTHRTLAAIEAELAKAKKAYMIHYRLAPEHIYPSALNDAVNVYKAFLAKGINSRNIIVTGDSAGGNLAVALALYLKEHKLPQPGMLILASPWTTMETNLPSRTENYEKDLVLGKNDPVMYQEVANPSYQGKHDSKDPRLSPVYADLSGLPPMLIQVGSYELFLDEGFRLAEKAAKDNVKVTITSYPAMPHDFALILPSLQEAVDSFKEIKDFIETNMQ
ncbi:MAG: alpha/beta hydrolase [Alistipes senegalensis]|nr:alpha/beta hydrolase [Oxalobacter formigenes]MCM1281679.1 alpha/beta hydrolase [Alistipes senegalensis]